MHELRLAARRLLACLELLRPAVPAARLLAARRALKRQLRATSPLRDTHVQLQCTKAMLPQYPELRDFRAYLHRRAHRQARRLSRHLGSAKAFAGERALDSALRHAARVRPRSMAALARDTRQALRRMIRLFRDKPLRAAHLHRVRLALKKFRYRAESLNAVAPDATKRIPLGEIHTCQTLLGEVRDLSLLESRLKRRSAKRDLGWRQWSGMRRAWAKQRRSRLRSCRRIAGRIAVP